MDIIIMDNLNLSAGDKNMNTSFTHWLQEQIDKSELNQSELAKRSGLYPSSISMVLSGERKPGVDFFIKIARGLRLPPGYVFEQYALSISDKPTEEDQLIMKTSGVMKMLSELAADNDLEVIYELAEILLRKRRNE